MPSCYLFGPVSAEFAAQNLRGPRAAGDCLAFNASGAGVDLAVGPGDSWADVAARLPAGWRPEFVALWLPYVSVSAALWAAPVPVVGLAADWNLLWHAYQHVLPRCELVLTDRRGVEALARAGQPQARAACLFGLEHDSLYGPDPGSPRDVDVLFVGNLHPAVQAERLPWLARVARLSGRWKVAVYTGVWGADYRALLARSKIVFNRSVRGEANRRAFEAAAAGALLFQEAENCELPAHFAPGRQYVPYRDDDLESLLRHYLEHDEERREVAARGQARARERSFEALWAQALTESSDLLAGARERARRRAESAATEALSARLWQVLGGGVDPALVADLRSATDAAPSSAGPSSARLQNALGVALATSGNKAGSAAACFAAAVRADPNHTIAAFNYVEAFDRQAQDKAVAAARRLLTRLDRPAALRPADLDAHPFPTGFDAFRVAWERAALENTGDPTAEARVKQELLRWRLHSLLADRTGDLHHFHEAVLSRPDLPASRAALGCALGRAGRPADALSHLNRAVLGNPFDGRAARALAQSLKECGDGTGFTALAADRRLLHRAAPQAVPAEPWFAGDTPGRHGLASLVVLCCNELAYTRQCLESVLRHTGRPYELVLVDNGSSDDTPDYLELVRARPDPQRVVIIRNEDNRGFPAGCNQGLAAAEGDYLVFLNNDVIVTPGWLDGLVGVAERAGPDVGLIGAVTNAAPEPQRVQPDYGDELAGLDDFAERRRREFAGRALASPRLTGFCLLARRPALDMAGGTFDEDFGTGFFDDDDLCVRMRRAGFRLLVALDVYVHHFGSRTFVALGIDCRAQLAANLRRFADKWGAEEAAAYRMPAAPTPAAPTPVPLQLPDAVVTVGKGGRPRVSLCLIVKNEEDNLPACLGSAADLVDDVVVVDTGSTDATKEVAARFGARVFDFPWVDSFSAARNESLRHAAGDWVFWMDADDHLDEDNRGRLRRLLTSLGDDNAGYAMKCLCLPQGPGAPATVVDHVRLFRNRPDIRWTYRVHEQILPAVRNSGGQVRWSDVVIHHTGYQDPALRRRKLERDLRLLRQEQAERPDEPFNLFNLGQVTRELGDWAAAVPLLRRSLERSHPTDSIVRKSYALLAECHRKLGQAEQAAAACAEGLRLYPDDGELLFFDGMLRRDRGDLAGAAATWERLLASRPAAHFASVDAALRGSKAHSNLALVYRQLGRNGDAEALWKEVAAEQPDFAPAWLGLGELALDRGDAQGLEEAAARLQSSCDRGTEAAVLRARQRLANKDFEAARIILEGAIAAAPRALWPRVVLSHVLLQSGADESAGERALRDVLDLDPQHAEARHNLGVLLAERERYRQSVDAVFSGNVGIAELYYAACRAPSDINEHLPALVVLARECRHITEMGTRTGVSTAAFLYAQPERLICYDRVRYPQVGRLALVAGRTDFTFREADVLWVEIEETDLLFIDTLHDYEQLTQELTLHADKVRRYILLHDTTTFGETGETPGHRGLWPAVEGFLAKGRFRLKERRTHNNGLTVLERVADPAPGSG